MPSELIEFLFFSFFLVLTMYTFVFIGWVIKRAKKMFKAEKGTHSYFVPTDKRIMKL